MIEWIVDQPGLRLGLGDSVEYDCDADLVFTHVYGPLPPQLIGKPAIINVYGNKKARAEEWCGAELHEVSKWAKGLTNTIYSANLSFAPCDLTDLIEDEFAPRRGWFPPELVLRLFANAGMDGSTVFDGFMGRGTVGKVALELGMKFVGIDRAPCRVALAKEYILGAPPCSQSPAY